MTIEKKYDAIEYKCNKCGNTEVHTYFTVFELGRCQDAFNLLQEKYNALLKFVKTVADDSVYEKFENINELNWSAFELLKEIGEA